MTALIGLTAPFAAQAEEGAASPARPVVNAPAFYLIRPGTLVVNGPPQAWSHLVAKAHSKLASGEVDTLPNWAAQTAASIRTVILADVGRASGDEGQFALRKVGVGLCMPNRQGKDIVVSAGKAADLGFDLGTFEKIVVESAEAEIAKGRLIVATPTFGVYRSPTTMLIGEEHRSVELYYGFLVNADTGDLKIVVWAREENPKNLPTVSRLVELRPNLVYECPINVKANRLLGTIPVTWSFAMQDLLPGRIRIVSPQLAAMMDEVATGQPNPTILEKGLMECLSNRSNVIKVNRSNAER